MMNIKYSAMLLCTAILLAGCSQNGDSMEPYMIKAGNKTVNLLGSRFDIEEQLGDKFSSEIISDDESSVIVKGAYYDEFFDGFSHADFHPVFDQENKNRRKFALYNGITVDTKKEQVEVLLGDCVKFEGDYTNYIEVFINGEEIDYSAVDTSDFEDEESEYSKYSQAARAYCAEQLKDDKSGCYVLINVFCYSDRDNDISVSVFKKVI